VQSGGGRKRKKRSTISDAEKVELLGLQTAYKFPNTGRTDWKELQRNNVKWAAFDSQNLKDMARRARKQGFAPLAY
jgi:hypothetical protein